MVLLAGLPVSAGSPPTAEIANDAIRARLYLPDAKAGFYRGTRFDWSGVIGSLEYAGHDYYPQWFQRIDPNVHDFVYEGTDIVAGPCTAVTGPAEEFSTAGQGLGYDAAKPGGTFIKIGVGVLRKPDDKPYDPYRLYPIQDGGTWTVACRPAGIDFRHELEDASTGYAYDYRKTVSLDGSAPRLILGHTLRNTGRRRLQTSVYNHNFLYLDRQPPGPGVSLTVPFTLRTAQPPPADLARVLNNRIEFTKTLTGEDRVYLSLEGFGSGPEDYEIRIENRRVGAGVRITGDRPLSRMALWAIRAPLSIEPFINITLEPGQAFTWQIAYEFFTVRTSSE